VTLQESLAQVVDDVARERGVALGKEIASEMLLARMNDGSSQTTTYTSGGLPGQWNRTAPGFLPPLLPNWGSVKPFAIADASAFRAAPPPALDSVQYAVAVDEVMRLGRVDGAGRTDDQTEIAKFWADGGGTATPPGHWNRIAIEISLASQQSTLERARTMALLNLALADAGIAAWDTKYTYDFWRPIDAIQRAAVDGNDATASDLTWQPLLSTPPHPTYTSGHSTFSGAGATVLIGIFGDNVSFATQMDSPSGLTAQVPAAVVTRHFASLSQAAEEAGISRIYGGIHFSFDNVAGLASGASIGNEVLNRWLTN